MGACRSGLLAACLALLAAPALAAEAPTPYKPGGWEATGSTNMPGLATLANQGLPRPATQLCVDAATSTGLRGALVNLLGAIDPADLPKGTVTTTATGFTLTSVDTLPRETSTFTAEVSGDAEHHHYRVTLQTRPASVLDGEIVIDSRWLGACPAGLRPGQMLAAGQVRSLSEFAAPVPGSQGQ